jgi:hypothetical protein
MATTSARIAIASLAAATLVAVAAPVQAAKVVKPPLPIVIKAEAQATAKGYATLRILIEKAPAGVTSTIISTNNGKTCTIKKNATACTISKVVTKWNVNFHARAMKGSVKGPLTPWINIRPTGYWLREGYNTNGVKFSSPTNASGNGRIIGNAAKWTKFQAFKRSSVTTAGLRQVKLSADPNAVIFQISGAVGLALSSASGSCGTNYAGQTNCAVAVAADGTNPSLYATGSPTPPVRDFYSAPNGKFYVVFMMGTALSTGATTCPIAEVDTDTGVPTCVDSEMSMISTSFGSMYGQTNNGNLPLQFDAAGNLYYSGTAKNSSTMTLRRNANGVITRIINDNITIRDFLVMSDGSILLSGTTQSTNAYWVRKISTDGAITTLSSGVQATFLRKFADGNAYLGIPNYGSTTNVGVLRYSASTGVLDATPWMAGGTNYGNTTVSSQNDLSGLCAMSYGAVSPTYSVFCTSSGASITNLFNFGTTQTIAITGGMGMNATRLMQYYPTVRDENTVIKNITIGYQVGGKLLLTGLDANNKNIVTVYNPTTQQESIIFDGSNEVEIYSVGYVGSTGKIMFNGLRFATGQVVVGDIAIP